MRHILYILALGVALCMTGCTAGSWFYSDADPTLDYVDSLLDASRYREAYNVLAAMDSTMQHKNRGVQMRYQLQSIKAADKISLPLGSDSLILFIISYYENEGEKTYLPEAYYYAGRTYASLNDSERALEYFDKALDEIKNNDYNSTYLKSRIHAQRGYVFKLQALYDNALVEHEKSYQFSESISDTIGLCWALYDIGSNYLEKGAFEISKLYYDRSIQMSIKASNRKMQSLAMLKKAEAYNFMGDFAKAEEYLNLSIDGVDESELDEANSIAGYIYFKQRKYDLAKPYYEKLLSSQSVYFRQNGEAMLLSMAANEKNLEDIIKHLVPYKDLTDSISLITDAEQIARINSLYNRLQLERQNEELVKVNMRNTYYIIMGGLLLLTVIAVLMLYGYRVRSERNRLRYNNAMLDKYLQEEQVKRSIAEQKLVKLADEADVMKNMKLEQVDERRNTIRESAIYQKLLNSTKAITEKDQVEIEELLNQVYPDFFPRLRSLGIVKKHDFIVCMLVKMGFNPSRIASMVSLTLSAITNTRKRMYGKVTGKMGKAEDWDRIVESL